MHWNGVYFVVRPIIENVRWFKSNKKWKYIIGKILIIGKWGFHRSPEEEKGC